MHYLPAKYIDRSLSIAIVGVGGTGSWLANRLLVLYRALSQINPSHQPFKTIKLFDPKVVTEANLVRTSFTQYDVGVNKAIALAERLNNAIGHTLFESSDGEFDYGRYDLVITCTDNAQSRLYAMQRGEYWLDTGVNLSTGYAVLGCNNHAHFLPNADDLFHLSKADDNAHRAPSCSALESLQRQAFGINDIIAGYAVQMLSQLFIKGQISQHGVIVDLESLLATPIKVCVETWQSYGFSREDVSS
jgi:PRTRC genetic system ThiF family protein